MLDMHISHHTRLAHIDVQKAINTSQTYINVTNVGRIVLMTMKDPPVVRKCSTHANAIDAVRAVMDTQGIMYKEAVDPKDDTRTIISFKLNQSCKKTMNVSEFLQCIRTETDTPVEMSFNGDKCVFVTFQLNEEHLSQGYRERHAASAGVDSA